MSGQSSACHDEQAYYGIIAQGAKLFPAPYRGFAARPSGRTTRGESLDAGDGTFVGKNADDVRATLIVVKALKRIGVVARCGEGYGSASPGQSEPLHNDHIEI